MKLEQIITITVVVVVVTTTMITVFRMGKLLMVTLAW